MSDTPEIEVKRRRKGEKPAKQTGAPTRRDTGSGSSGSGGGTPSGSLGRIPGGSKGKIGGCGMALILLILVIVFLISPGTDNGSQDTEQAQQPEAAGPTLETATRTPRATLAPSSGSSDQTWLVMLYQDADDQALEQDIYLDFNEAERVGSTDQVKIVAQLDRYRGGFQGDEDWRSTRRYLVTQDDDLNSIHSELIEDLGEANMADGDTLVDFVTWAIHTYPSDRYALILSDHGMGWPGGWSDPAPGGTDSGGAPLIQSFTEDQLFLSELDDALGKIQSDTGIDKLDLIGLDACLMSQMEVFSALQAYARYAVASEETEPGLGWAYAAFLGDLENDPGMDGAQMATHIVDSYVAQDERIVDNEARNDYLRQGSSMGGFFGASNVSASQLASQMERSATLTAIDLDAFSELVRQFNAFAYTLQNIDPNVVASSRSYAQSYTSIFGNKVPPSYIDLGHFVALVAKQSGDDAITAKANDVFSALRNTVIAEKHGKAKPGSTGIALYFPNSTLYRSPQTGLQSYTALAKRFSKISLWDDYLVYYYNDRSFKPDSTEAVTPSSSGVTRSPGSGEITISAIRTSAASVSPGGSIEMSAEVSGSNIAYLYLFTGYYDSSSNSLMVADTDYLESEKTGELNGVYYPVWPEGNRFRVNFEFEPALFSITDGSQSALALFNPVSYGSSAEEAVYSVQGTYTFASTGEKRKAELYFKNGRLFQVVGFKGADATSPSEISPENGDAFTLSRKWMELDTSGNITGITTEDGDTLTFSESAFEWEQVYAPPGTYAIGFIAGDMDGNLTQAYAQVKVQ